MTFERLVAVPHAKQSWECLLGAAREVLYQMQLKYGIGCSREEQAGTPGERYVKDISVFESTCANKLTCRECPDLPSNVGSQPAKALQEYR